MFFLIDTLFRKKKMSGPKKFGSVVFFGIVLLSLYIVLATNANFNDISEIDFIITWFFLNPLSFFVFGLLAQPLHPAVWIFIYAAFTYVTAEMYAFLVWGFASIIVKINEW